MNGYGERCGNANLVSILPALQLKLGYECVPDDRLRLLTETAHFVDELCNTTPDPDQPYVGRNAFAHKGGMHVAGRAGRRAHLRAHGPEAGRQQPRRPDLRALRQGLGARAAPRAPGSTSTPTPRKRAVERIKEREHRGYHYEAADASFDLLLRREAGEYEPLFRLESFRVITEKRADGQVETEATIKIWVDGQPLRPHRGGQRPGQRARPRAARRDRRAAPAPRRDRAGQLQGPDPRRPPRHRRGHPRPARLLRRPRSRGARSGSRRTSSRRPGRRSSTRSSTRSSRKARRAATTAGRGAAPSRAPVADGRGERRADPARAARRRRARGGAGARGAAVRAAVAGADAGALRARLRRLARRRRRGRGLVGHRGASPRRAGARLGRGRRGGHLAVQLRRLGELPALRGRHAGLLRRRPGHPQPRPGGGVATRSASAPRACCPVDILGYPAAMPELEAGRRRGRPRAARGRLRGARRRRLRRAAGRLARQPRHASPSTPTSR